MKTLRRFNVPRAALLVATMASVACDPEGPGAQGVISVGSAVRTKDFASLQVSAYPDSAKDFDPENIPDAVPAHESWLLADVTFPQKYDVGEGIGTTDSPEWRMTAWLSHDLDAKGRPQKDDPVCSVRFEVDKCSAGFGGYCTVSNDVSCTIE
jgi:hypothetical protein